MPELNDLSLPQLLKIARQDALLNAAAIARMGCLVPPDGGSPTEAETEMCDRIAEQILALIEHTIDEFMDLPVSEKVIRFNRMVAASFSHMDGRDLLAELYPRAQLDIKRQVNGKETWFDGNWLTKMMSARDGRE